MPKLEEDIYSQLHYLKSSTYDNSNFMTKEFIDNLLEKIKNELGYQKGSDEIFDVIQERLNSRINPRDISSICNYTKGDMLIIDEAIKKGFNIDKNIDLIYLKEKNLNTLSQTLDKYYNSIYEKALKEKNNFEFYIKNKKDHLIASGGPSYQREIPNIQKEIDQFNNDVKKSLVISDLNNNEEILLKDYVEKLKNDLQKLENNKEIKEEHKQEKNYNPVSFKLTDGVKSEYYNIKYDSKDFTNQNLVDCVELLITDMAVCDAYRNDISKNRLFNDFNITLSYCENKDDIYNFQKFMEELSNYNGYAKKFYEENIDKFKLVSEKEATELQSKEKEKQQLEEKTASKGSVQSEEELEEQKRKLNDNSMLQQKSIQGYQNTTERGMGY